MKRSPHGERGQIVILAAISMVLVLSLSSFAIDIGFLTRERRDLQNDADAMALAGASQLSYGGAGQTAANTESSTWATKNGVANGEIVSRTYGTTCSGATVPNTYTVRLRRTKSTFLARIIGINDGAVAVCATATRFAFGGGTGMAPFGVEDNCVFGPDGVRGTNDTGEMQSGTLITIKYDSQNDDGLACGSNTGNFWTLGIDDTGTGDPCGTPVPADNEERKLREAICFGAITPLCTPAAFALGEDCETTVDTEPGNKVSATRDAVSYLVTNAPANCNTLAEIVETTVVAGVTKYSVRNACNPFLPGYVGVSLVKMIPVLNGLYPDANGRSNVPIVDFMVVVIDPSQVTDSNWCKGNSCDLKAQIMDTVANPTAFRRTLTANNAAAFSALTN